MATEAQRLQQAFARNNYSIAEPEVVDACINLAQEFGIATEKLADEYEIMNSLKENTSIDYSLRVSHVTSTAFRSYLVKQHGNTTAAKPSAVSKLLHFKQPFGSSWENMSDREMSMYQQPTPKRQALGQGPVPAGKTPGSTGAVSRTPPPPGAAQPKTPGTGRPAMATPGSLVLPPTAPGPTSESARRFATRTTRGDLVSILNGDLPEWQAPSLMTRPSGTTVQLVGEALPPAGQHLYMNDTLEAQIQTIEESIQDWAGYLADAVPEAKECQSQSVSQITQEPTWCVGRVVTEMNAEEGQATKLSVSSIHVEGSRSGSDGARVRLDVTRLQGQGATGARFYPGQMVGVRGVNPTGNTFIVQSVVNSLPAEQPPCGSGIDPQQPCCIMAAAGPYTTNDSVCYTPLEHLLQHAEATKPDLLVLLGPFVDVNNNLVRAGAVHTTYEALFNEEVLKRVTTWQSSHRHTTVLLLPSVQDAHHAPVFPTPAFSIPRSICAAQDPGQLTNVASLQSPCVFTTGTGSLCVAASSTDVLKAVGAHELPVGNTGSMDRLSSLAAQIIGQRNFMPVFPAPLGTCLDTSHASALRLPVTPHIMFLPSDMGAFAKLVTVPSAGPAPLPEGVTTAQQQEHTCVCINPGRLIKGAHPGTFALLNVQGGSGKVASRCRVEIRKV